MSIGEFEIAIQTLRRNLTIYAGEALEESALDLLQDVQARVQNKGEKADGSKLKEYSPSYLAFKKNPKGVPGVASSRYSGVVDYTFTSRMWNSIKTFPVEAGNDRATVVFGTSDQDSIKKLRNLNQRDNHQTLKPSPAEIQAAANRVGDILRDRINRLL